MNFGRKEHQKSARISEIVSGSAAITPVNIARTAKKIVVKILLSVFRAIMGLKKVLLFLLKVIKIPLFWIYQALVLPLLGAGYKLFRMARRHAMDAFDHLRDGALRIVANRFAPHALLIILSCTIAVSNIQARSTAIDEGGAAQESIAATLVGNEETPETYAQEVASENLAVNADVSYLGSQAVSTHSVVDDTSYDGTDSGQALDDGDTQDSLSPFANAVRVQPEVTSGTPSTRTRIETHVVQNGETLGVIAGMYGLRIETIMAANKLSGGIIHPGQSLRILPVDGVTYTVKKGDTLNKIANAYRSSSQDILEANGLADASGLTLGMELILPGGKAPVAPKPAAPSRIEGTLKDLVIPSPAPDRAGTGKLLWPTAARRITQYWRGARHTGVDIAGPIGTAIYAAGDGVVLKAEWNRGGYGYMTVIDHGGGIFTRYGHASKLLTVPGQQVHRGDLIALMGSTGHSTGPHLHFEVMTGVVSHRVNPLEWVR